MRWGLSLMMVAAAGVAACGVEYRPGGARTDSASGDSAATARVAPDTVVRTDTVVRVDTVRVPADSLIGFGEVPPSVAEAAPPIPSVPPPVIPPATIAADEAALRARGLRVPVEGVAASALRSNFSEGRSDGRTHEALDILAPRGTPVVSADDGRVAKLFTSRAGGLTIYVTSLDGRFMFYYAHLDRYRDGLAEGAPVRKGEVIGYVGTTGNAAPNTPHLHFAIARLTDPAQWWSGTPIDPYPLLQR